MENNPDLKEYVPEDRDWLHVDKEWLCNVLYTLDREGIKGMVTKARKMRKEIAGNSSRLDGGDATTVPRSSKVLLDLPVVSAYH